MRITAEGSLAQSSTDHSKSCTTEAGTADPIPIFVWAGVKANQNCGFGWESISIGRDERIPDYAISSFAINAKPQNSKGCYSFNMSESV